MDKKDREKESCEICTSCPICYKKAIESGEDFKLMAYFTIFIIIAFIVTKIFEL